MIELDKIDELLNNAINFCNNNKPKIIVRKIRTTKKRKFYKKMITDDRLSKMDLSIFRLSSIFLSRLTLNCLKNKKNMI